MLEFPVSKPAYIINQVCGSGLRSVAAAYQSIVSGDSSIVVAGGQESMSNAPHSININKGKKIRDIFLKQWFMMVYGTHLMVIIWELQQRMLLINGKYLEKIKIHLLCHHRLTQIMLQVIYI